VFATRLDILVANVGLYKAASIEDTTVNDFDELFPVNVCAPFFLVQQLLPIMDNGSSTVLLSSLAAHAAFGAISAHVPRRRGLSTPW
jgi:3-oxoacyl-[acyl-carrier protein] reductase